MSERQLWHSRTLIEKKICFCEPLCAVTLMNNGVEHTRVINDGARVVERFAQLIVSRKTGIRSKSPPPALFPRADILARRALGCILSTCNFRTRLAFRFNDPPQAGNGERYVRYRMSVSYVKFLVPEISCGWNDRNVALIGQSDRESDRERAGEYYYRVTNRSDIPVRRCENSSSKARERELSLFYLASDFRQATGGCANEVTPRHLARFQPFETLMKGARWGENRNEVGVIFHPEHLYTIEWVLMSCPRSFSLIREN